MLCPVYLGTFANVTQCMEKTHNKETLHKSFISFYTISFRKRHMESSVHSHCGNSCRHRPLSWELPLPVSSCTPQQFMFGDTKNCLYFITDFTYSLAARSVLWRLQDCEFLVVRCSYCSYIIFPESPKLHYRERWDLVAGPLKEGTLVTVTNRIFFRSLQRVWRAEAVKMLFNI